MAKTTKDVSKAKVVTSTNVAAIKIPNKPTEKSASSGSGTQQVIAPRVESESPELQAAARQRAPQVSTLPTLAKKTVARPTADISEVKQAALWMAKQKAAPVSESPELQAHARFVGGVAESSDLASKVFPPPPPDLPQQLGDLVIGQQVYYNPSTQKLTSESQGNYPLYIAENGMATFTPGGDPYIFGLANTGAGSIAMSAVNPAVNAGTAPAIFSDPETSAKILDPRISSLFAFLMQEEGLTEREAMAQVFPHYEFQGFGQKRHLVKQPANALDPSNVNGVEEFIDEYYLRGPIALYNPNTGKPIYTANELQLMGFSVLHDAAGQIVDIVPPKPRSDLGRVWDRFTAFVRRTQNILLQRDVNAEINELSHRGAGGLTQAEATWAVFQKYYGDSVRPQDLEFVRQVFGDRAPFIYDALTTDMRWYEPSYVWVDGPDGKKTPQQTRPGWFDIEASIQLITSDLTHKTFGKYLPAGFIEGVGAFFPAAYRKILEVGHAAFVANMSFNPAARSLYESTRAGLSNLDIELEALPDALSLEALQWTQDAWESIWKSDHENYGMWKKVFGDDGAFDAQVLNAQNHQNALINLYDPTAIALQEFLKAHPEFADSVNVTRGYLSTEEIGYELHDELVKRSYEIREEMVQRAENNRAVAYDQFRKLQVEGVSFDDPRMEAIYLLVRDAINIDRTTTIQGLWDPYHKVSWSLDAEAEQQFMNAVVQMELQLGRPLNYIEIHHLSKTFTDPSLELVADVGLDVTLFLSGPFDLLLGAIGKYGGKYGGRLLNAVADLPGVRQVLAPLRETANASLTRKVSNQFAQFLSQARRGFSGNAELFEFVEGAATVLDDLGPRASFEAAWDALRKYNPAIGKDQAEAVWMLSRSVAPSQWRGILGNVVDVRRTTLLNKATDELLDTAASLFDEAAEYTRQAERLGGHDAEELMTLANQALERAANIATPTGSLTARAESRLTAVVDAFIQQGKYIDSFVAEAFSGAMRRAHTLKWSNYFWDDSVTAAIDNMVTSAINKLDSVTNLTIDQTTKHGSVFAWLVDKKAFSGMSDFLRQSQKHGRWLSENILGHGINWLRNTWITAALSARPGFSFINAIDSNARAAILGAEYGTDMETLLTFARSKGIMMDVFGGSFGSSALHDIDPLSRFIIDGWRPKATGLGGVVENARRRWTRDGLWSLTPAQLYRSWTMGWQDFNIVTEASVRLRTYYANYHTVIRQLQPSAVASILEKVPEGHRAAIKAMLDLADGDPYILSSIMDVATRSASAGNIMFTQLVPQSVLNSKFARTAAGQQEIRTIAESFFDAMEILRKSPEGITADGIYAFFKEASAHYARAENQVLKNLEVLADDLGPNIEGAIKNFGAPMNQNQLFDEAIGLQSAQALREEAAFVKKNPLPADISDDIQVRYNEVRNETLPRYGMYSPEQNQIIEARNAGFANLNNKVDEATRMADAASGENVEALRATAVALRNAANNAHQAVDKAIRMAWDFLPGPIYLRDVLGVKGAALNAAWQEARYIRVGYDKAVASVIDDIIANPFMTKKEITEALLEGAGLTVTRNDIGDVVRLSQLMPGGRTRHFSNPDLLMTFRKLYPELFPGIAKEATGAAAWGVRGSFSPDIIIDLGTRQVTAGQAFNDMRQWLRLSQMDQLSDDVRKLALDKADEIFQEVRPGIYGTPISLAEEGALESLERFMREHNLADYKVNSFNLFDELNATADTVRNAEHFTDIVKKDSAAGIGANFEVQETIWFNEPSDLDFDLVEEYVEFLQVYKNNKNIRPDNFHGHLVDMNAHRSGMDIGHTSPAGFAVLKTNQGNLFYVAAGMEKEFYTNTDLWKKGLGVKRQYLNNERKLSTAYLESKIMSEFADTKMFPIVHSVTKTDDTLYTVMEFVEHDLLEAIDLGILPESLRPRGPGAYEAYKYMQSELGLPMDEFFNALAPKAFGGWNAISTDAALNMTTGGRLGIGDFHRNNIRVRSNGDIVIIDLPGFKFRSDLTDSVIGRIREAMNLPRASGPSIEDLLTFEQSWAAWAKVSGVADNFGPVALNHTDFVQSLHKRINDLLNEGFEESDALVQAYKAILQQADEAAGAIRGFQAPEFGISPPPVQLFQAPPGVQNYINARNAHAGQLDEWLRMLGRWGDEMADGFAKGTIQMGQASPDLMKSLTDIREDAIATFAELQKVVNYGGEASFAAGRVFDGAVNTTNKGLVDYAQYSRFDSLMKNVYPFWVFQSRNYAFWAKAITEKPWIYSLYQKYMLYSERQAIEAGAITSTGEPLPSLEGYIKIPGIPVWVNPLAPLSLRAAIPHNTNNYDESEERGSPFEQLVREVIRGSNERGFSLPPWLLLFPFKFGILNRYEDFLPNLVPLTALIPPNHQESLRYYLGKYFDPETAQYILPQVGWLDLLVEKRLMSDAYTRMLEATTEAERLAIAREVEEAITKREESPLYRQASDDVQMESYYRSTVGFFTGIYGKTFTDADAHLISLRTDLNFLRDMVNSQAGALLFELDPVAENRYRLYSDAKYQTPEGYLHNLYNTTRYVRLPDGTPLHGDERRDYVGTQIFIEQQTRAYFDGLAKAREEYDAAWHALGIGAPFALRQAARDTYLAELARLEQEYEYKVGPWYPGVKPPSMIMDHFVDMWFGWVRAMEPRFESENYRDEYAQFLEELPSLVPLIAQHSMEIWQDASKVAPGRLPPDLVKELQGMTNAEAYQAWKLSKDGPYEAIDKAWEALVLTPYFDAVSGLSGNARTAAEIQFMKTFKPVSFEQITAKIQEIYGGRFGPNELRDAWFGREQYTPESYLDDRGEALKGELYEKEQRVWDLLSLVAPGRQYSELLTEIERVGGDADDVSDWYDFGVESWDPEKLDEFTRNLTRAIANLDIKKPTLEEVQSRAQAQQLNDTFKELRDAVFPDIQADYDEYRVASNKSQWRKENPERWARIQASYDFADLYGTKYPSWARYYRPEVMDDPFSPKSGLFSSTAYTDIFTADGVKIPGLSATTLKALSDLFSFGASLPASAKAEIDSAWAQAGKPKGSAEKWVNTTVKGQFKATAIPKGTKGTVRIGVRATLDPRRLLLTSVIGSAKPTLPPTWPQGLTSAVGFDAIAAIVSSYEAGEALDPATIEFLRGIASRHPDWKELIEETIANSM